jgi:transposase
MDTRRPYPSDVSDEEWAFVAPYLTLLPKDAGQRRYELREVFNGPRYLIKSGAPWRWIPHDLPPWIIVYQQTRRWREAGAVEALVADLRLLLRLQAGRTGQPSAVILDSRTMQSTPESGARAGYDGHKRRKGSKVHAAVDTLGQLLELHVTPANEQDRAQVGRLAEAVQDATGEHITLAFVDQGYTGSQPAAAHAEGIELQVIKLPTARQGFVLLPRRWVVEIVHSQTTKPNGRTVTGGGEHVADLDIAVGDNDTVDQEFDKRPPLLKSRRAQAIADLGAKRLERLRHGAQRDVLLGHGLEAPLLTLQRLLPAG